MTHLPTRQAQRSNVPSRTSRLPAAVASTSSRVRRSNLRLPAHSQPKLRAPEELLPGQWPTWNRTRGACTAPQASISSACCRGKSGSTRREEVQLSRGRLCRSERRSTRMAGQGRPPMHDGDCGSRGGRRLGRHWASRSSAARSSSREASCSLRKTLVRWPSTVRVVTNSVCAISRLVRPWLACSAIRRSLAVSESSPLSTTRRGRAPVARSSVSACSASGLAPARDAASSASRRSSRASVRRLRRRSRAPRLARARALSNLASARSSVPIASRSRASPLSPPATTPAARIATPRRAGHRRPWRARALLRRGVLQALARRAPAGRARPPIAREGNPGR